MKRGTYWKKVKLCSPAKHVEAILIRFKCKDFLLKECEFEVKGTHSLEEMLKLVEVHATEAHRTIKLSPETLERIRLSVRG